MKSGKKHRQLIALKAPPPPDRIELRHSDSYY